MVRWVPRGMSTELFRLCQFSTSQVILVQRRPWYVLSCLWVVGVYIEDPILLMGKNSPLNGGSLINVNIMF